VRKNSSENITSTFEFRVNLKLIGREENEARLSRPHKVKELNQKHLEIGIKYSK